MNDGKGIVEKMKNSRDFVTKVGHQTKKISSITGKKQRKKSEMFANIKTMCMRAPEVSVFVLHFIYSFKYNKNQKLCSDCRLLAIFGGEI